MDSPDPPPPPLALSADGGGSVRILHHEETASSAMKKDPLLPLSQNQPTCGPANVDLLPLCIEPASQAPPSSLKPPSLRWLRLLLFRMGGFPSALVCGSHWAIPIAQCMERVGLACIPDGVERLKHAGLASLMFKATEDGQCDPRIFPVDPVAAVLRGCLWGVLLSGD